MNLVILVLSVVLPLLPVILFPTRFFGRGLVSTAFGAVLLVGMMMLLYFGLQSLTAPDSGGLDTALPGATDADLSALEKLFK